MGQGWQGASKYTSKPCQLLDPLAFRISSATLNQNAFPSPSSEFLSAKFLADTNSKPAALLARRDLNLTGWPVLLRKRLKKRPNHQHLAAEGGKRSSPRSTSSCKPRCPA